MVLEVDFHVTNRCNAACDHCVYSSGPPLPGEMTTEEICRHLEGLRSLECTEIHLTGGEPLLRGDLFDIVRHGIGLGLSFRLQSNGLLLAERASELHKLGVRDILVSIDGPERYHDEVRGVPGLYAAAERAVTTCVEFGMNVRVNSVVRASNRQLLPELFHRTGELGAAYHSFFFLTRLGRGRGSSDSLTGEDYADWCRTFLDGLGPMERHRFRCQALGEPLAGCRMTDRDHMLIMADGAVYACVFLHAYGLALGSTKETSIQELWLSSPRWEEVDRLAGKADEHRSCPVLFDLYEASRGAEKSDAEPPSSACGCVRRYLQDIGASRSGR